MGLQQGNFAPLGTTGQPALPLSEPAEKSWRDPDLWEGIEQVAVVHLASGLIFGAQSGSCGNGEEHRWSGWSCFLVAVGRR